MSSPASWIDAYLPDGGAREYESVMRREEAYDTALAAKEVDLWASCLDPLFADELVVHDEIGVESLGSLLCLAAYAKDHGKKADKDWVIDRLIELFERDIERIARYEVAKEGY